MIINNKLLEERRSRIEREYRSRVPSNIVSGSWNRLFAVAIGAGFLLLGAIGFLVSLGTPPLDPAGVPLLLVLTVNPLQSVVTMATGALLLVPGLRSHAAARNVNRVMGALLLTFGIAGLYVIGTPANLLAVNAADVLLQFAASALLLGASFGADRGHEG